MNRKPKLILAVSLLCVAAGVLVWSQLRHQQADRTVENHAEAISSQLRASEPPPPLPEMPPPGPRKPRTSR